jgi:hypothetical protein
VKLTADHVPPSIAVDKNGGAIPPFPICLHGVVFKYLSTGTNLNFYGPTIAALQSYATEMKHYKKFLVVA